MNGAKVRSPKTRESHEQPATFAMQRFAFHGTSLDVIVRDGKLWLSVRRACETLGVDYKTQWRKLTAAPWAVMVIMTITGPDGKNYETLCIARESFPMWMATINASKVAPRLRGTLEAMQIEAAGALDRHFFPRAKPVVRQETTEFDAGLIGDDPGRRASLSRLLKSVAIASKQSIQRIHGDFRSKNGHVTSVYRIRLCHYDRIERECHAAIDGTLPLRLTPVSKSLTQLRREWSEERQVPLFS